MKFSLPFVLGLIAIFWLLMAPLAQAHNQPTIQDQPIVQAPPIFEDQPSPLGQPSPEDNPLTQEQPSPLGRPSPEDEPTIPTQDKSSLQNKTPVQGQAADCDSYRNVPVNITTRFDEAEYDYSQDITKIMGLANDTRHSIREHITLGLTRYSPIMSVNVASKVMNLPDGLTCALIDHIDVTVGYQNVTVYIANEIPQNSCGFQEVMAHEMKHVGVNKSLLEEYKPIIENKLKDYLKFNSVFREPNPDYAISLAHDKLYEILNATAEDFYSENGRRQHLVDTPQEYRRISATCNGQLWSIAQKFQFSGE